MLNINLKKKKFTQISLSESCKAILLGSLLGDGSLKIYKPYKNARFWIRHSINQQQYWIWKTKQLDEIKTKKSHQIEKPSGYSKNKKLLFQSAAKPQLTEIYNITYKKNSLQIKRRWLNFLTPLSLVIWWLDDGSIINDGKRGVLCTDGFPKTQIQILKRYLFVVWEIETHIGTLNRTYNGQKKQYFRLYINNTSLKKLFRLIMPFTPIDSIPSMLYKYCLLYKDTELQERWISEMISGFSNFPENKIRDVILLRKKQLKNFRK
uniref:Homing endonuclease LAGLIDADG domain-containing protein n=1 Tax=Caulerpa verticillata TaxID=177082 RepID=A0A386B067_9CHLO|nr:hypothetical protein [Caulerpa verticillata]AYC65087.1 hypothetical protein [Caulerpa verticillata]